MTRFGILGCGQIARRFVSDLAFAERAVASAVGSRDPGRARAFAGDLGVPRAHGDYAALVDDPEVDVVYVATPHPFHVEHALLALRAGKGVLCEKPLALSRAGAERMIEEAERRGLFFMEAMWTRFIPACVHAKALVDGGALGDVRWFQADFGFPAPSEPDGRLLNLALGGGALLDIGVYPVAMARWLLGPIDAVAAVGRLTDTGVDGGVAMALRHTSGALSSLSCSFETGTPTEAVVSGPEAVLRLHAPFHHPRELVYRKGYHDDVRRFDFDGHGLRFEADEVARCVEAGLTESPAMPWSESLEVMDALDEVRAAIGLRYPPVGG